jgi:hypothetical protein
MNTWFKQFWSNLCRAIFALIADWRSLPGLLVGLGAIAGAGWWMLNPRLVFNYDMENSLWMMSYQAQAWRQTGSFALTLNNVQVCGMPYPLFYGWGFYPMAGVLTAGLGARLALRVILFGALAMQYTSIIRLGRKVGLAWEVRHVTALAVTWAIYPLTNLYNRGDMPEFIATAWLFSAVACLLTVVLRWPDEPCLYERWAWGFFYLMALTTHTITGFCGGLFIFLIALTPLWRRPFPWPWIREMRMVAGAGFVISLPWLYVLFHFMGKIPVANYSAMTSTFCWTYMSDHWSELAPLRIWPFARELWPAKQMGQLDTQISDALLLEFFLLLAMLLLGRSRWKESGSLRVLYLSTMGLSVAIVLYIVACAPELQAHTAPIFAYAQFPYRLVNYIDLGLFVALIAMGSLIGPILSLRRWLLRAGILAALVLAVCGLVTKLHNGAMTGGDEGDQWSKAHPYEVAGPVSCFYGRGDYAVIDGLPELTPGKLPVVHVVFAPRPGGRLDEVSPQMVSLKEPTLITTQIEAFPWNALIVDGQQIVSPQLGYNHDADPDNRALACVLPAGDHVLSFEFNPSPFLPALRSLAMALALLWAAGVIWQALRETTWARGFRGELPGNQADSPAGRP